MNLIADLNNLSSLLPLGLRPYTLWVLLGAAVVLVLLCWPIIRFILRVSWVIRILLALASFIAFARLQGCSTSSLSQIVSLGN